MLDGWEEDRTGSRDRRRDEVSESKRPETHLRVQAKGQRTKATGTNLTSTLDAHAVVHHAHIFGGRVRVNPGH